MVARDEVPPSDATVAICWRQPSPCPTTMSSEFVIPYDIVLLIAEESCRLSTTPASDWVAFAATCRCLYQCSKAWSKVWRLVHQAQFGPLPAALVAPSDHDHGWRDLVLQRVAVVHQDTLKIASLLVSQYRLHATIR